MKVSVFVFVICVFTLTACSRPPRVGKNTIDPLPTIENKQPDDIQIEDENTGNVRTIFENVDGLNPVFFDYDKADIRTDQVKVLQANARYLQNVSAQRIQIQGHCDERGTEEYNLALGDRRARAVKEYLAGLGISNERLSTISYGEAAPFENEHNESAWSKNRRAQFLTEYQ